MAEASKRARRHWSLHTLVSGRCPGQTVLQKPTHHTIYYCKVVRKELLRPPISDAERGRILALLRTMRLINPDPQIAAAYSDLLGRYPYLRDHLADALIAASAWAKNLALVTTNLRHFQQIQEIEVVPF